MTPEQKYVNSKKYLCLQFLEINSQKIVFCFVLTHSLLLVILLEARPF